MTWERNELWNKAVLFMSKASVEDHEKEAFGLWAALGLELLARSAIASTSPLLLAEPDKDQKNILYALGFGSGGTPKSISTIQVLSLCRLLIANFTEEEFKSASSLLNRRNEELHTGSAAFLTFPTQIWLPSFYRCCKILAEHQKETLESLFGVDEAKIANETLGKVEADVMQRVKNSIAAHAKVFDAKENKDKERLISEAKTQGDILSHRGHHRVTCPACKAVATVQGTVYGGERVEHKDGAIIVRKNVVPTRFACPACELKLNTFTELLAAGVADHFTHRVEFTPEDYYELVDPNDHETMAEYAEGHGYYHFSND